MANDMYDERPRRFDRGGGNFRPYSGGSGGPRRSFAPVKEGEEIEVAIEAIAAKGDGIAKKQGFVIFVPNSKVGDNLKIRITKVLQRVAFSEIIGKVDGKGSTAPVEQSEESEPAETESTEEQSTVEDTEDFGDEEER